MSSSRIGIGVGDLRLPARQALERAARLGFGAVQLPAAGGELSPRQLSASGRRELAVRCRGLGLQTTSLADEPAGAGLADPGVVDRRVSDATAILRLAADLRVPVVAANAGAMVDVETGEASPIALGALQAIAEEADRLGTIYALETGADPPAGLLSVVQQLNCPWLRVCLDPAWLTCSGYDPVEAAGLLAEAVAHSHIGDALRGTSERAGAETRLGEGQVDVRSYLAALAGAGYGGPLILRRRTAERPVEELAADREALARLGEG